MGMRVRKLYCVGWSECTHHYLTLHYYLQMGHTLFLGLMMESRLYMLHCIFISVSHLSMYSPFHSALSKIITTGYQALNLQYFFTCGHDEVRAWTIMVSRTSSHCYLVLHHFGSKSLHFIPCPSHVTLCK